MFGSESFRGGNVGNWESNSGIGPSAAASTDEEEAHCNGNAVQTFPLEDCDLAFISEDDLIRAIEQAPVENEIHYLGNKVVRISKNAVAKFGSGVFLSEASTMQFAAARTKVNLPTVHRALARPAPRACFGQRGYIVMDYVEGRCLADCWSELSKERRASVYDQVTAFISEMHSLTVGTPGPLGGGYCFGPPFHDEGVGPFATAKDMEDWFNKKLAVCKKYNRCKVDAPSYTGQFTPLVLCHMDISPRNIILNSEDHVWLLDWGRAGGFPHFFEASSLERQSDKRFREFHNEIRRRLPASHEETQSLKNILFSLGAGMLL